MPGVSSVLDQEQLTEIKKVFSLCDRDGDGTISGRELGTVIQNMAGVTPTAQEVQELMKKMDTNNDGVIEWSEFLASLGEWLGVGKAQRKDDGTPQSPSKARAQIHHRISTFFLQFKRASNFQAIRAKLMDMKENTLDMKDSSTATAKEKIEKINYVKKLMESYQQMAVGIQTSNDQKVALNCTKGVAEVMSLCDVFKTADERYEIAELIVLIFQRVQEAGIIPRISKFLTVHTNPELQFHALRILTYFAPGPRIAHTPKDSVLHPDKMTFKTIIMQCGALDPLIALLNSPSPPVQEQAVLCLGKIACHDPQARDFLLLKRVYEGMCGMIKDGVRASLVEKITWSMSVFCGYTHPQDKPPNYELVSKAMSKLAYLFFRSANDEAVLFNVCVCWQYLLPGVLMEDAICKQLAMCLGHPSVRVQKQALKVISDILRTDNAQSQKVLSPELLSGCRKLLMTSADHVVKLDCCELVSIIAGEKGYVNAVLKADLGPALIHLLNNDELVRWKVVKVVLPLTRGIPAHLAYITEKLEIVKALSGSLLHFKVYDPVLRDIYKFVGASYNFEFVHDVVTALDNILKGGESSSGPNAYVKYFDMECVDKLRQVCALLCGELLDQIDAWRSTGTQNDTLEDSITGLLIRIKDAHEKARTNIAGPISSQIIDVARSFSGTLQKNAQLVKQKQRARQAGDLKTPTSMTGLAAFTQPASGAAGGMSVDSGFASAFSGTQALGAEGPMVSLKLFHEGDNRVLEVPRSSLNLRDLSMRIQLKYGKQLILQYEDSDNDRITIDSPEVLQRAFLRFERIGQYKLFLMPSRAAALAAGGSMTVDAKSAFGSVYEPRHSVVSDLLAKTRFSKQDLDRLYDQFQRSATNGRLNKAEFSQGLRLIGQTDQVMIDQLFTSFDHDKDGFIDFREFAAGLSVMHTGSLEERLYLAFKAYDLDGNGRIDRNELFAILRASFRSKGFDQSDEMIRNIVEQCFAAADINRDGVLDFDEFKLAVMKHQIVVQSFWKLQ